MASFEESFIDPAASMRDWIVALGVCRRDTPVDA
jgi:hypothetical protein